MKTIDRHFRLRLSVSHFHFMFRLAFAKKWNFVFLNFSKFFLFYRDTKKRFPLSRTSSTRPVTEKSPSKRLSMQVCTNPSQVSPSNLFLTGHLFQDITFPQHCWSLGDVTGQKSRCANPVNSALLSLKRFDNLKEKIFGQNVNSALLLKSSSSSNVILKATIRHRRGNHTAPESFVLTFMTK